jgi:hypothetical protein
LIAGIAPRAAALEGSAVQHAIEQPQVHRAG